MGRQSVVADDHAAAARLRLREMNLIAEASRAGRKRTQ